MREVVVSAATLAGLVGLACLYSNGNGSQRVRREAEIAAIDDSLDYDVMETVDDEAAEIQADLNFIKSLGWLDNASDAPTVFQEDIALFQQGKLRKSVQFITKCMKNNVCRARAEATVRSWGKNFRAFMEAQHEAFMFPIITELRSDPEHPSGFGGCTPSDEGIWPCTDSNGVDYEYTNTNPQNDFTQEPALLSLLANQRSTDLNSTFDAMAPLTAAAENNVFTSAVGGSKIVLIIPNGVPITMSTDYQINFSNYWGWFVNFNEKYLGITKTRMLNGRSNMAFWFFRQDEKIKPIMKSPIKGSKKFPWNRFAGLMNKNQNTAIQPKFKGTYGSILQQINKPGITFGADLSKNGMDCFVLWFHQYLPQDLAELGSPETQDNYINALESKCTVIHIWVGLGNLANDEDSVMAARYLQGILQPGQKDKTTTDHEHRGWFYVQDLNALESTQDTLGASVYNIIAAERNRVRCLMQVPGVNIAETLLSFAAELAKQSDYFYDYGTTTINITTIDSFTTTGGALNTTLSTTANAYEPVYQWNTTVWTTTEAATVHVPEDWACCGIGFGGLKYDTAQQQCCNTLGLVDNGNYCY